MAAPVLKIRSFPVTLPSSNKDIQLRPYLVAEEKMLLMAQQSNDDEDITDTVAQIIRNCTFDVVDPRKAPYFDVEYLLLQLRIRSTGNIVKPVFTCRNKTADGICGHAVKVEPIDLTTIKVSPFNPNDRVITIDGVWKLTLTYPTIYNVAKFTALADTPAAELDALVDIFESIENTETNEVWDCTIMTDADKLAFMYQMEATDIHRITDFIRTMPTVTHSVDFKCDACKYTTKIHFEGVLSFFD